VCIKTLHIYRCGMYLSAMSSVLTTGTVDAAVQTTQHQATNCTTERDSHNIPADAAATGISLELMLTLCTLYDNMGLGTRNGR